MSLSLGEATWHRERHVLPVPPVNWTRARAPHTRISTFARRSSAGIAAAVDDFSFFLSISGQDILFVLSKPGSDLCGSDLCGSAFMGYVPSPLTTHTAYLIVYMLSSHSIPPLSLAYTTIQSWFFSWDIDYTSQMIYHRGGEPERAMHCWLNFMAHKPWIINSRSEFVTHGLLFSQAWAW